MLCIRENADKTASRRSRSNVPTALIHQDLGDQNIAAYIRSKAAGSIAVIGGLFFLRHASSRIGNRLYWSRCFRSFWRVTTPMWFTIP